MLIPRITVVLAITCVILFGICEGNDKEKRDLENEIKKTKKEQASVLKEIKKLENERKKLNEKCTNSMKISNKLREKENREAIQNQNKIQELYQTLQKTKILVKELLEAPKNVQKLQLGIRVLTENIQILQERRTNGMTKQCMELEGMAKSTMKSRISMLSRDTFDGLIHIRNNLRTEQTTLMQYEMSRYEVKLRIKSDNEKCQKEQESLNEIIKKIGTDRTKAQHSIDEINKALQEVNQKMEEATNKSPENKEKLEKMKREAKKMLDKYHQYTVEITCYEKLHGDFVAMVSPPQKN